MVRIGLRKENTKSVIVTKDREFKRKAIAFLNGSAIAAEKINVEHMQGALDTFNLDADCANIIFDANRLENAELMANIQLYAKNKISGEARLLIFLDESLQAKAKAQILQLLPGAQVYFTPMTQLQFNNSFHGSKVPMQAPPAAESKPSPTTDAAKAALTLLETSAHLKETVEMLNAVAKDKQRIDTVRSIGQRFNGLIGAFGFFKQLSGYPQMLNLARIIDDISRTYREDHSRAITDGHWQLMMESAKTLYLVLKDMREGRPINDSHSQKAAQLEAQFQASSDICRRNSQTQDEVDQLLESELLKQVG